MSTFKYISVIAWSIGYFPFQSPSLHSRRAPCCSFANLYTVTVILLGTYMDFDLLINRPLLFLKDAPIVLILIWISSGIMEAVIPLACRITGVVYGRKFSSAVRDLEKLSRLAVKSQKDWTKFWFYVFLVSQSALHVKFWYTLLRYHLEWAVPVGDMVAVERFLWSIWEPLVTVNNARAMINPTFCELVATWLVVWTGLEMRAAHAVVFDLLISMTTQNSDVGTNPDNSAIELFENLRRVKEAFKVCGQVIGVYTLFVLGFMVIYETWIIYTLIWPHDTVTTLEDIYFPIAQSLLTIYLGQTLEDQIKRKREELKEALVSQISALFRRPKVFALTNHAIEWSWSLTAGSLFEVNLYCIPGVIGALTTYTIFMVQLQLDEDASKSYNCSAGTGGAA